MSYSPGLDFKILRDLNLLIVDDDQWFLDCTKEMVMDQIAYVHCVSSYKECKSIINDKHYDIILIDVNLRDGNGFDLVEEIRSVKRNSGFILMTGSAKEEMTGSLANHEIQTMLIKPFSREQLQFSLSHEYVKVRNSRQICKEVFPARCTNSQSLTGSSRYIKELQNQIELLARSDVPVLINGPTGTSKEIIAHMIHEKSKRSGQKMIPVNSSAIPEHLEESEFFGYARGAFTGANSEKLGILQCADSTTLFLDEVAELSLRMQAKLLRVLDGYEFCRVGETIPRKSNFRLITATNRSLTEMIKEGTFREDLYFRIKATQIATKPLNDHPEDIPELVEEFLLNADKVNGNQVKITPDAMDFLIHSNWPGNIRELRNTILSIRVNCVSTGLITRGSILEFFGKTDSSKGTPPLQFSRAKEEFEKDYYQNLLVRFSGNVSMAARAAGLERAYFSKRVKSLGFMVEEYRC